MNLNKIKEQIQNIQTEIQTKKEELLGLAKGSFNDLAQEIFDLFPEVKSFAWPQYTPYFNDGEPCEFGVYLDEPIINGYSAYGSDDESKEGLKNFYTNSNETTWEHGRGSRPNPDYCAADAEVIDTIEAFIAGFGEETLRFMFGEGLVNVTPGNVNVEEHDHE